MVKLSDIDLPMIFKDKLLFKYGIHNNYNILSEEMDKSFSLTDWSDQRNRSLYFSHSERDAQKWVGRITNPRVVNGELFGDLEIHDADLAMKLGPGKAPIGVSAEIRWPPQFQQPTNFSYRGFAMVPNPELQEAMVNFSKETSEGFNTAKIHTPFKENNLDITGNEESKVVEEKLEEKNAEVESVAEFSEGIVTSESARGSKVAEEKEESNLMSAERGLKKEMEENNANDVTPEVKEDVVKTAEEVKTPVEETKEEVVEKDESKVDESKEAEFSALNEKFEALSARVIALEENQAKFSEAKEAEVEEVVEEAKEDEVEEKTEKVEEAKDDKAEAKFSELAEKVGQLADAISKKEAAPMSTAEFGSRGVDKETAVIDRLTKSLSD